MVLQSRHTEGSPAPPVYLLNDSASTGGVSARLTAAEKNEYQQRAKTADSKASILCTSALHTTSIQLAVGVPLQRTRTSIITQVL